MSVVNRDAHSICVCVERPWTSLACVLINSLLVIPSGAACWDSSLVPPPVLRLIPSVSLFLNMASELHSKLQSFDGSFFFLLLKVKS